MNSLPADLLVERACAGDADALHTLLIAAQPLLATHVARKLPDWLRPSVAVDDIIQETHLRVAQELPRFRPQGSAAFQAWVLRIAENRCYDLLRAALADKRGGGAVAVSMHGDSDDGSRVDRMLGLLAAHQRTPSRDAAEREAAEHIQAALEALKPEHAQVIRLRYLEGHTIGEIAAQMQRSEAATSQLLHRAMEKLEAAVGSASRFLSGGA